MTDPNLDILVPLIPIVSTIVFGFFSVRWIVVKRKISLVRKLIDVVDEALTDDKITEAEFRDIFYNFYNIVKDGSKN